jgi:uncharacterized surface protein with fasciclin (FAS1) repeats
MLRSFALTAVAVATVAAAACSSSNPSPVSPSAMAAAPATSGGASVGSIATIASGNPAFTTLVSALAKAGLVDTFSGQAEYTVFAPTNAAFDAAAKAFNLSDGPALVAALDVKTLTAVLTYHVTAGTRMATSVVSAGQLTMLDGNAARITSASGAVKIENATITSTDIRASNGYIHVIDAVLLPPALR